MAGMNLLLSGKPGVGKTTVVERVVQQLRGRLRMAGFTTAEMREASGARVGFRLVTLYGAEGELARANQPSSVRVGRYGVSLETLERLALPELARREVDLLVVDEIGKMECASGRFRRALEDALDAPVNVLGTLGVGRLPFFQALRERPDVELLQVTERNRQELPAEILRRLAGAAG